MRRIASVALMSMVLAGCATFKELQPDPELSPAERGYIELRNDDKRFELDHEKKYFIVFPPPPADNFVLVLATPLKPDLGTYLTATFDDGKGQIIPIGNLMPESDSLFVYPVDRRRPQYYWVIDSVRQDLFLDLRYRYAPRWRFTFETRYDLYKSTLAKNRIDRGTYEGIGNDLDVDRIPYAQEQERVRNRTEAIDAMRKELLALQEIFPEDIVASKDTAYKNYVALREQVDDELAFQQSYGTALAVLSLERETRGSAKAFIVRAPDLAELVGRSVKHSTPVAHRLSSLLERRLSEIAPYYDKLFRSKTDAAPVEPAPSVESIAKIYRGIDRDMPIDTEGMLKFVDRFNMEAKALADVNNRYASLKSYFNSNVAQPPAGFLGELQNRVGEIRAAIPEPLASRSQRYGSYPAAVRLGAEIDRVSIEANDLQTLYRSASTVHSGLGNTMWGSAEMELRRLFADDTYRNPPAIADQRTLLGRRLENELVAAVTQGSQARVDAFARAHETDYANVPALYQDSVFTPVYRLTFSSLGADDLARKRAQIDNYLDHVKHYQFPETSIKNIYRDLLRNTADRGVEKARAIVAHGDMYQGDDKQVKAAITECNPQLPKWVVKPKEYRRVFALPTTNNRQGTNEYLFRIRLQIPSEAEFPVFDVHLKLPAELAERAGQEQWYDAITINKKPIKNEGRFRITSPMPSNDYESQITPVQMDKEGNNILEIRFRHPGLKLFEVSAMAQVPIIRKN